MHHLALYVDDIHQNNRLTAQGFETVGEVKKGVIKN